LQTAFRAFGAVVSAVLGAIGPVIGAFFHLWATEFALLDDLFHGRWAKLWGDVKTVFIAAWDAIKHRTKPNDRRPGPEGW